MRIRLGCEITYALPQTTPMIALLNVHFSRFGHLDRPDYLVTTPSVPIDSYRDNFGNWCTRLVAPAGRFVLCTDGVFRDDGRADPQEPEAVQHAVENLPHDAVSFLLPSRYCDSDRLMEIAWGLFASSPPGWARVQAVSDYVHQHVEFGYGHASSTRTASETYAERRGVCRDFAHLAVAFCRCLNIPARYCTGYLSDVGQPLPHAAGDFAAWIEVYLAGRWWTFDPRNGAPRIGRILIARGRDAADVPLVHTFGANELTGFRVWTDEIE
jgi:transglutaminase-like putative cysteine protease